MGAWGPGIFSDDLAVEVRERYRELMAEGGDPAGITDAVRSTFADALLDEYSAAVFWLALAVTQWRTGRLEERVREKALAAIVDQTAMAPWSEDAALARGRHKELEKTVALLNSPQPPSKRIRKRYKASCDWEQGELIAYRLRSGRYVAFRVAGLHVDRGGSFPVVEVLDWCGDDIPSSADLQGAPIRSYPPEPPPGLEFLCGDRISRFMLGEVSERRIPRDRIMRLREKLHVEQAGSWEVCWLWRVVDQELERRFDYR